MSASVEHPQPSTETAVAVLSHLLRTNFASPLPVEVATLPSRCKTQRAHAQNIATALFPDYTETKAIIQYEILTRKAKQLFREQLKKDREAELALNHSPSYILKMQGPWNPLSDPAPSEPPKAAPMPVQIGERENFKHVFAFLRKNGDPREYAGALSPDLADDSIIATGKEEIYGVPTVEFVRGIVYTDGRLDLCKMVIGPDHIDELMNSLDDNTVIRHFLLGNNVITNLGARRIARFIREHPERMETWYLAGNHIKGTALKDIADALIDSPVLTNLWLKRNPLGSNAACDILRIVCSATKLRTLDVEVTELGDAGVTTLFNGIAQSPNSLQTIYINGNGVGLEGCKAIATFLGSEHCKLTGLFMSANPIGDPGAAALSQGISVNKTLQRLNLASCGITSTGIITLSQALQSHPTITSLDLSKAVTTTDLGQRFNYIDDSACSALEALIHIPSLRILDFGRTALSESSVARLRNAVLASNLVIFSVYRIPSPTDTEAPSCSRVVREALAANVKRFYPHDGGADYDTFVSAKGGSRIIRNSEDVRLIDSVYRTRDKRQTRKPMENKYWGGGDELWARLDAIP